MIKLNKINKYYLKNKENEIHVINNVSLELPDTGLISFLGPSGSGKTTLLNVIGGLDSAKGSFQYNDIVFENYNMNKVDAFRRKNIGYVFQNYNLLLEETVYDNLAISLEMLGIYDKEEQNKRIEYTLNAVGMYKYRKKRAFALSGGQQQRVAIARALVKKTKIIIADEPTGNLDSENTIEIMNILKKVSESSLVLLVTHNEEVANFYSDLVYRLKNGQILEAYKPDSNGTLERNASNILYLKDYDLIKDSNEAFDISFYSNANGPKIELKIVERNGTFYLESNQKIKLVVENEIQMVDAHYEAMNVEDVKEFDYDTSWFKEEGKKGFLLKRMGINFKKSFDKMRFATKRTKFLNFAFVILGILLAICAIGFANYSVIDESQLCADSNYYQVYTDGYTSYYDIQDALHSSALSGDIYDVETPIQKTYHIQTVVNLNEQVDEYLSLSVIGCQEGNNLALVCGRTPQKKEIVISRNLADKLIARYPNFYHDYQALIAEPLEDFAGDIYTIVGVTKSTSNLSYLNDSDYVASFSYLNRNSLNMSMPLAAGGDNDTEREYYKYRYYNDENAYEKSYEIIAGEDLTDLSKDIPYILLPENFTPYGNGTIDPTSLIGQEVFFGTGSFGDIIYICAGVYKMKYFATQGNEIIAMGSNLIQSNYLDSGESFNYNDHYIVAGRAASNYDECVVSIYSGFNIGEEFSGIKVVGKYNAPMDILEKVILYHRDYVVLKWADEIWFRIDNRNNLEVNIDKLRLSDEENINVLNVYNAQAEPLINEQQSKMMIFGIFSFSLILCITIFIYFMMRSKMISDIYSIGVYRSLGVQKSKIYMQFLSDILVTITLTSLISYLLTIFVFNTMASSLNSLLSASVLRSSGLITLYGVLLLYALNVIFGLLPIFLLMRKTPAQITAKYDI